MKTRDINKNIKLADNNYVKGHVHNDIEMISKAVELMENTIFEISKEQFEEISFDTKQIIKSWGYEI